MSTQHKTRGDETAARLLTRQEVEQLTGLSRSSIYRNVRAGTMPAPVRIGRAVRWRLTALIEWADELAEAS